MPSDGKESSEELRRRSKLLLGSGYQAEVGAVIADAAGPIWGKELLGVLDLRESDKGLISKELKRLREAQLLVVSDEDEPYDRRKRFVPVDPASPYWALCSSLRDALA